MDSAVYEAARTPIKNISVWRGATYCVPHYHQAVEIVVALTDGVSTRVNNNARTLLAREICVADCFDVHASDSHGDDAYILIIPKDFLSDYLAVKQKKHLSTPFITDAEKCEKIIACVEALLNDKPSPLTARGYVNTIMGLVCEACGLSEYSNADITVMQSVLDYLEENSNEEIDLDSLSKHFGYNKYYFSRLFNDFFKFNLNEYLARMRIRNFITAMHNDPHADITGTALNCGFNSQQTFYRCFTKYYGVSPKEYLKRSQTTDK